ncbi:MAG TPA: ABC transporter ATP-binding protein [Rhodoblastus sp.]|nr:ABC transporter ATP-binding protein [Rhodoblastus sp.]
MLSVSNIQRAALKPVSFMLADGECLVVRGPSGAGKSTLLRAIADLDPNEGEVRLDGALREKTPAPEWRRNVIYMAAEPAWWAETAAAHFPSPQEATQLAQALGLAPELLTRPLTTLSTGERQRLALARALARHPRVLLLDEPTAALDAEAKSLVEALVAAYRREGLSVLWVTHDAAQAARIANRLLTLEKGEVRPPEAKAQA